MTSRTTASFRKALLRLPSQIQDQADEAFAQFQANPQHPGLELKQVHPSRPIYSARVTLGYRALAVKKDDGWVWFWIGSHAEYDSVLRRI